MNIRRSARIANNPRVSYHDAEAEVLDLANDDEDREEHGNNDGDGGFLSNQGTKRKRVATVSARQKRRKTTKPDIFRWSDLSGEIKNMIYEYALIEEKPFTIEAPPYSKTRRHFVRRRRYVHYHPLALSLLLVNKQMHAEAAPIFFSRNKFRIYSWRAVYFFLRPLRPQTKECIESIEVYGWEASGASYQPEWSLVVFDALVGLTSLQSLKITFRKEMKELYQYAYNWLEAIGKARGDKYAGLQVLDGLFPDQITTLKGLIG